ncbi:hypothetical protein Hanom_Chr09g00766881 [Helianthus anomalus]
MFRTVRLLSHLPCLSEVVKLLKVSANQLLDKNIELANEGSFLDERKASLY